MVWLHKENKPRAAAAFPYLDVNVCRSISKVVSQRRKGYLLGKLSKTFQRIFSVKGKLSRPSGKYPDYLETFQAFRQLSRLSGNFPGYPEAFQVSGNFPGYLEIFRIIRKISSLSGNFPGYPKTFQTILKISRLSGNLPDHPENIQTIWKFCRQSTNFPVHFQGLRAKTFRTRKNFPDGNATMPRWFLGF